MDVILSQHTTISLLTLCTGLVIRYFQPFIKNQEVFEKDIKLLLSKFKEKVCTEYNLTLENAVLQASLDASNLSSLRGSPPHKPDLIGNYTNILFNNIEKTSQLKRLLKKIRTIYNFLFISVVLAFIALAISLSVKNNIIFNNYAGYVMYILFFGQITSFVCIRYWGEQVKFFEEKVLEHS